MRARPGARPVTHSRPLDTEENRGNANSPPLPSFSKEGNSPARRLSWQRGTDTSPFSAFCGNSPVTIEGYECRGTRDQERARKFLHHHLSLADQLGPQEFALALSVRHRMLRNRIHGGGVRALRYRAVRIGSSPFLAETGGRADGPRHHQRQNGAGSQADLRSDGRAEVGD